MTTSHYLPDRQWTKLASALLVAAADPYNPETEIRMILAENAILPECTRADIEKQARIETDADRRALARVNRMFRDNTRAMELLMRAHAGPHKPVTLNLDEERDSDPAAGAVTA